MSYRIKEIFYSLQGEGFHAGRPAVFCRFAGCNLWSGREGDRLTASCSFCDTDFSGIDGPGGGCFETARELGERIDAAWSAPVDAKARRLLVFTGGEPLLQLDEALVGEVRRLGFEAAVETNGTRVAPPGLDWICVSPKAGVELVLRKGDELKLVYPQKGAEPALFEGMDFDHFFLQPRDDGNGDEHARRALRYCLDHPRWRLSLQIHKYLGIA